MNNRDEDQYAAEEALGEIAEITGITPHVQDVPGLQCPCKQMKKALALVAQLSASVAKLMASVAKLTAENNELREIVKGFRELVQ